MSEPHNAKCSEEEFIRLFESVGAAETARVLGVGVRKVYDRRRNIEKRTDRLLVSPNSKESDVNKWETYQKRVPLKIQDGCVLVGSDAHYWPEIISPAHRAMVYLAKELKPKAIVLNGDVVDGAQISRHPKGGWTQKPKISEELDAVTDRTHEIAKAAPNGCKLFWTIGNHDMRFEARLAQQAGEFEGVAGFSLPDHFDNWSFAISVWINNSVVVKHRFKGGIHATHNNTLWAGMTMVTGHLHSLKVTPFSDYTGTRFGVDTGTMADPYGAHADYDEDNPKNHRSGLAVLTFRNGRLLWPELVHVLDDKTVEFRGELIRV